MTDEKDQTVTDISPTDTDPAQLAEALRTAPPVGQDAEPEAPTHWAIPIATVQRVVRYLKKSQCMDDVEQFVYDIQEQAVPLTLTRKE